MSISILEWRLKFYSTSTFLITNRCVSSFISLVSPSFFLFLKLYHGLQHHMFLWGLNFHKLHQVCLNCRLEITMLPDATCGFSTQWHQIQMSTVWLPSYSEECSEDPYIFSSQCNQVQMSAVWLSSYSVGYSEDPYRFSTQFNQIQMFPVWPSSKIER